MVFPEIGPCDLSGVSSSRRALVDDSCGSRDAELAVAVVVPCSAHREMAAEPRPVPQDPASRMMPSNSRRGGTEA